MSTSVDNLAVLWASLDELCSALEPAQWALATGCPGWTVKDQLSHLIDYEARAVGRSAPDHEPSEHGHVKNDLGRGNEIGVDFRRSMSGPEVLEEFRSVTADRLDQLRGLSEDNLRAEMMTPAGPGTVADMLTLRVMDTWSHEQDIRRAVGRPGDVGGPAVDEAIGYFTRFLSYLVGKRAGAPEGAKVVFAIGDRAPVAVEVIEGRGRVAANAEDPTVDLAMPVTTFAALVGGRSDAPDDVVVSGDAQLAQQVLASMALMP